MGKGGMFRRTGMLNKPPVVLLNALAGLQARHIVEQPGMSKHVEEMLSRRPRMAKAYAHQGRENDWLFEADYDHVDGETCEECERERLIQRGQREDEHEIVIHAGNIASGDEVMKDGKTRDRIAASERVICFEMEAAGLMDNFPCLVVRGICDYADSQKHKRWQRYAAATASAYAKELLLAVAAAEMSKTQQARDITQCVHKLPFSENHDFIGRRDELRQLEQKCFGQTCRRRVALVGLGGIGKTQVALSFAYKVRKEHADFSVFWIPAVSAETVEKAFEEIAKDIGLPTLPNEKSSVSQNVCRHLSSPSAGSWLLIIDNAGKTGVLGGAHANDLMRQLPHSDQGLILITTRTKSIAQSFCGKDMIELDKPSDEDATRMLTQRTAGNIAPDDRAAVSELLMELDNLPLAITQAAAYVNVNGILFSTYLDTLRSTEQDAVEILGEEVEDATRYPQSNNAVARTWLVTFQQIIGRNAHADRLLQYISCIEWKAIPESILPPLELKARMVTSIGILCSYSFLARRGSEKMYDMHRLVHLSARSWYARHGHSTALRQEVISHLSNIFPSAEYANRDTWRTYLPHAARLRRDNTDRYSSTAAGLLLKVGSCLRLDGKHGDALTWLQECYGHVRCLDEANPLRLSIQHELAVSYKMNGRSEEASTLLLHVVAVRDRTLAETDFARLDSQLWLAWIYLYQRRAEEARTILEHVHAIRALALPEENSDRLDTQDMLARAYLDNRQVKEAIVLLEQVVTIREKELAEEHPTTRALFQPRNSVIRIVLYASRCVLLS